ncbi:alginate lyase family protein [Lysobacter sp. CA199]|uniref:alginate lyase family protein n=1 Tax=Lysobacter sp. CA199 TaxID=3455608 RepID=UPI003F8D0DC6
MDGRWHRARHWLALAALSTAACAHAADAPVCRGSQGFSDDFGGRRTFLWRPDRLSAIKAGFYRDKTLAPASKALLAHADAALAREKPYTVVDKTRAPASGDMHDYTSMGPYWWPDPDRPDGLPYIRRDGRFNPERDGDAFDVGDLEHMSADVRALALAHYFTGRKPYADKAGQLLRTWFLDPATRMNPNFDHAQAIPGRVAGRAEGVIDAHRLARVVESVGLLRASGALSDKEHAALEIWFAELVRWMDTSTIGIEERAAANNHGLYYDTLIVHFALFARQDAFARDVAAQARARRIDTQIDEDGRLPLELKRTRSLHYVTWTLAAAFDLADAGRCLGVDLWEYRGARGQSLRAAVDFLLPYAGRESHWPYPEIDKSESVEMIEVLRRAAWQWPTPAYLRGAARYRDRNAADPIHLLIPAPPDAAGASEVPQ